MESRLKKIDTFTESVIMKLFQKKYLVPIVLVGVGLYLLLKPSKGMAAAPKPPKKTVKPLSAGYDTYIVTTSSTNLNVRKEPSTTSPIVGSLAKGSEVFATPTPDKMDWFTLLDEDLNPKGYVSSKYLKKK
jgi:uncharacterized protein YgiM (DUF1202 family)